MVFNALFIIIFLPPICLRSVLELDNDVGNKAYELAQKCCEEYCYKHYANHSNDRSKAGENVLSKGVVVCDHHSEEYEKSCPDKSKCYKQADDISFCSDNEVGRDGCGNHTENERS